MNDFKEIKINDIEEIKIGDIISDESGQFGIVYKRGITYLHGHYFVVVENPNLGRVRYYEHDFQFPEAILRNIKGEENE